MNQQQRQEPLLMQQQLPLSSIIDDFFWNQLQEEVDNDHQYMSGIDRDRHRLLLTAEVFTPTPLVIEIMQDLLKSNPDVFAPGKTVLDPSCGDGQFLVTIKLFKMKAYGVSEQEALNDIYGVDIMRDNIDLCKKRLGCNNTQQQHACNVVMGDFLNPSLKLSGQTDEEHRTMVKLFAETIPLNDFFFDDGDDDNDKAIY